MTGASSDSTLWARPPQRDAQKRWTLAVMCMGVLIAQVDTSVVNLMLRPIGTGLDASVSQLQWVVDAYNLAYACLLLTGGVLGDLYGRRRIFLTGILAFTIGSLACGLAPNPALLVAARSITGLGAAFAVPVSLAIIAHVYPEPAERAKAVGIWASCNGLALAIGPTLGGFLVNWWGWRSAFLVAVPVGVLAIVSCLRFVPESSHPDGRRFDMAGQVFAMLALGALSFAAIRGGEVGWDAQGIYELLLAAVVAAVAAVAFTVVEKKVGDGALLPLGLFRSQPFSAAIVVAVLMTFGMYGMMFLVPLYLQEVRGITVFAAGIELLPMSVVFFLVARISGSLAAAAGPKTIMTCGMALMGLGLLGLAFANQAYPLWLAEGALAVIGLGLGLNSGPVVAVAVASVPQHRTGTASGVVNAARIAGAALGVAIVGAVFATYAGQGSAIEEVSTSRIAEILSGLRAGFLVGAMAEWLGALTVIVFIPQSSLGTKAKVALTRPPEPTRPAGSIE